MAAGLPSAAFTAAAAEIGAMLAQLPETRSLTPREVAEYGERFQAGWAVPKLCTDPTIELRVLLPGGVPFFPARIAVAPTPVLLVWPHVEEHGLLCQLSDIATVSLVAPATVVMTLLEDARKLVNANLLGENIQDFEDEFTSYWERWDRIKTTITILCEPQGPSRKLIGWHSTSGSFAAESEAALRSWVENRFGKETVKKMTCWPVPLLWLPRPLRPAEYPATVSALRMALQEDPLRRGLLDAALLASEPEEKFVVLGMETRRGVAFAGLQIHKVSGLHDGFRGKPPQGVVLTRYNAAATTGARAVRFDPSWVHGRDHNPEAQRLRAKTVVIIGVGSLGSSVADLLVKAGVGTLTLVDGGVFGSENSSRHLIGAPAVGVNKATAVQQDMSKRFPHVTITAITEPFTQEQEPVITKFRTADLILAVTGSWSAESLLDALWGADPKLPPIVYGWTEPHAVAGHALALLHGSGCLRCVIDDLGKVRVPVASWPANTLLQIPACGDLFQPYGAIALAQVHALVAELALDVLLERITSSTHRVWIGRRDLLARTEGVWSTPWIAAHGDPGAGGQLQDAEFSGSCNACRRT